jgi:hypothetical protein
MGLSRRIGTRNAFFAFMFGVAVCFHHIFYSVCLRRVNENSNKPRPCDRLRYAALPMGSVIRLIFFVQPSAKPLCPASCAIAKLEKRTDMYIPTLRSHVEAMGGTLEILAHFPDGSVRIANFSQLDQETAEP